MTDDEIDIFSDALGPIVKEMIAASTAALTHRLAEAEAQIAVLKERGSGVRSAIRSAEGNLVLSMATGQLLDVGPVNGRDGKDADMALVERMIDERVLSAVSAVPVPVDGRDADPKDVAIELRALVEPGVMSDVITRSEKYLGEIKKAISDHADERIDAEIEKRFAALPLPENGKDAEPQEVAKALQPLLNGELMGVVDKNLMEMASANNLQIKCAIENLDIRLNERLAEWPLPVNGKDADPSEVAEKLRETLKPDIFEDVMKHVAEDMIDIEKSMAGEFLTLAGDVRKELADRIAAIPVPTNGKDGVNGKDADPELIETLVTERVERAVAALPKAQDGHTPTDDEIVPLVEKAVEAALEKRPVPKDGVDGLPGVDGKDGASVTLDDIVPLVEKSVDTAMASRPVPKDGVGMAGAVVDREGRLILTLSDGTTRDLGNIVGKDADMEKLADIIVAEIAKLPKPRDGIDGKDGFSLDDFSMDYDGERTFTFRFVSGDTTIEKSCSVPFPLDRGVWKKGDYEKGDGVTWDGSFFLAQRDTQGMPLSSTDWRQAVKAGRPGKNTETVKVLPPTVKRDDDKA